MKTRTLMKILGSILGLILVVVVGVLLFLMKVGPSGVVASLRLADGSEYMVTQRCNWSLEPYTVAFYMRPPGGEWGWCYLDHQANRWRKVTLTHDVGSDVVTVTKGGIWQAALDRKRSVFALGEGEPRRELMAPQDYHDPPFSFPGDST